MKYFSNPNSTVLFLVNSKVLPCFLGRPPYISFRKETSRSFSYNLEISHCNSNSWRRFQK
jgi:hypothetical protein